MPLFTNIRHSEAEYSLRDAGASLSRALRAMYEILEIVEREANISDFLVEGPKKACIDFLGGALDALQKGIQELNRPQGPDGRGSWQGRVAWAAITTRIDDEIDARAVQLWAAEVFGNLAAESREVTVQLVIDSSIRFIEEFRWAVAGYNPHPPERLLVRTSALIGHAFMLQQLCFAATRIIGRIQDELRRTGR